MKKVNKSKVEEGATNWGKTKKKQTGGGEELT